MTVPVRRHLARQVGYDQGRRVYSSVCCTGNTGRIMARQVGFDQGRRVYSNLCCPVGPNRVLARQVGFDQGRRVYAAAKPCCTSGSGSGSGAGSGSGGGSGQGSGQGSGSAQGSGSGSQPGVLCCCLGGVSTPRTPHFTISAPGCCLDGATGPLTYIGDSAGFCQWLSSCVALSGVCTNGGKFINMLFACSDTPTGFPAFDFTLQVNGYPTSACSGSDASYSLAADSTSTCSPFDIIFKVTDGGASGFCAAGTHVVIAITP